MKETGQAIVASHYREEDDDDVNVCLAKFDYGLVFVFVWRHFAMGDRLLSTKSKMMRKRDQSLR